MNEFKNQLTLAVALLVFQLSSLSCRAGEIAVGLGIDAGRSSNGSKGSSTELSVPLSVSFSTSSGVDLGAMMPVYVYQNNASGAGGRTATIGGRRISAPAGAVKQTSEGIGDLDLLLGYTFFKETDTLPKMRTFIDIKLPTAREPIGTGRTDGTFGLELSKWLSDWYLFADGGYTIQGRTSLYKAANYYDYDVGFGYELLRCVLPSIGFKGSSPVENNGGYVARIEGKVRYSATRAIDIKIYADRGMSAASPDWEFGGGLSYNLDYSCDWF